MLSGESKDFGTDLLGFGYLPLFINHVNLGEFA